MSVISYENPFESADQDPTLSRQLQKIVEASIDVICVINAEGQFVWLNPAAQKVWGYSPQELLGKQYIDFVIEDDRPKTLAVAEKIRSGNDYTNFENRYLRKDGSIIPITWSATWDDKEEAMYCIARDSTEKKRVEEVLEDRNRLLQKALRVANMGTWEYDVFNTTVTWSDELFDIYGIDRTEENKDLVRLFMSRVHPDDLEMVQNRFQVDERIKYSFIHRFIRPGGNLIYVRQSISSMQNIDGRVVRVTGLTQDITETIDYEEQLRFSEQRFKALVQSSSDMVGIMDLAGTYNYVSDNVKSLLGYEPESLIGKNAFDFIHSEDAQRVYAHLTTIALEKYVEIKPFRFKNEAGEWRWVETRVTNLIDDPAVEGIVVNSRDVTEKKRIQDKIAQLSKIAEETGNAVVITDKEGRITWVNTAFEKITGYKAAEVEGKKPGEFLQGPSTDLSTVSLMRESLKKKEGFDVEIVNFTRDGKPYWIHIQCQPQHDDSGELTGFFAIQTDVSERKRLEDELRQEVAQRQKRITSAMLNAQERERSDLSKELHDNVNQILTTVKLYLEMAQDGKPESSLLVKKATDYVMSSINEIRKITKRLAAPEKVEINLYEAIQELVDSFSAAKTVKFDFTHYGLENSHLIEEVSLAIFRVAQEHLTNVIKHADASKVQVSLSIIAGNLTLLIVDNGKGFDVSKKRKGIGLNNMYNRIETFNGRLDIKSREGEGCTLLAAIPLGN